MVSPDRSRPRDAGSAVVEFAALAVLLLVPLVYVCVTLGRVQAATFAAQGAASEGGRAYVTADRADDASARAQAAAALAAADQGFDARELSLTWSCAASPCLRPAARIDFRATVEVVLPGVPRLLDRVVPTRVQVAAVHVATVDRYRAVGGLAGPAADRAAADGPAGGTP
ncbi:TadE/TadG family type IV pilus assembly protein [Angustibacter aerolatus]